MIKAVLFDFDGTLADTLPLSFRAFQKAFKTFDDRELSDDEVLSMFGPSEPDIIKKNLESGRKKEAIELYYKEYTEHHSRLVKENDEIIEVLKFLKGKGIKTGMVTGKSRRSLDISLKELNLRHYFEVIITGDDVMTPKPHSEGVVNALSLMETEEDEAIFIGDSDADITAGENADVITVAVEWLPGYQPKPLSTHPDYTFEDTHDFKHAIERLIN